MNITWIIGNGFDLNLGLQTSYGTFMSKEYLSGDESKWPKAKRLLVDRARKCGLSEAELWSDLEALLGIVSSQYDASNEEEVELFHEGWEELMEELETYLAKQDNAFLEVGPRQEEVEEFWSSVVRLGSRLKDKDSDIIDVYSHFSQNHYYSFLTLNYTHTIDAFVTSAKEAHSPFATRTLVNTHYDSAVDPLHVHGVLATDRQGGIVMGVSDPTQIANEVLASDDDALALWIKARRNNLYRNRRNEQLKRCISESNVIIIYGCSLGKSDAYIWKQICGWIANNASRRLLILDYRVPPLGDCHLRGFQKERKAILGKLAACGGIDEEQFVSLEDRIVVENSGIVFAFNK